MAIDPVTADFVSTSFEVQRWRYTQGHYSRHHWRVAPNQLSLVFPVSGAFCCDTRRFATPTNAVLVCYGSAHQFEATTTEATAVCLILKADFLQGLRTHAPLRPEIFTLLAQPQCSPLFLLGSPGLHALIEHLYQSPPLLHCLPLWYQAKVMELSAFCLYPLTNTTVTPSSNRNPLPHSKVIREVIQLLESDLISPPTLEEIAHKLRQNPFQLSRRFSAEMGHGIPEHLRKTRIQRASALLSSSDLSISEIALEVGYNSFSAFTRAFVREQNQSPSAFRRSLQAS